MSLEVLWYFILKIWFKSVWIQKIKILGGLLRSLFQFETTPFCFINGKNIFTLINFNKIRICIWVSKRSNVTEKNKLKLWKFHTMPYYNWYHCQRNALQNLQLLLQNANSTYLTEPLFHLYKDKYFSICSHFQGERFWKKYFGKDLGWSQINHIYFLI